MPETEKRAVLVDAEEQSRIIRTLLTWFNGASLPVDKMDYEYLPEEEGLSMATEQSAHKTRQYLLGGYEAEYVFRVIYRSMAENTDQRLAMDEALNAIGAWAETTELPDFGDNIHPKRLRRNTPSAIVARYDDGTEDHQLSMTLLYEVI